MGDNNHQNKNNDSQLNETVNVSSTLNEGEIEVLDDHSPKYSNNLSENQDKSSIHDKGNKSHSKNSEQPDTNQLTVTDEESRHEHARTVEDTQMDQSTLETSSDEIQQGNPTDLGNIDGDEDSMDTNDNTKHYHNQLSESHTVKAVKRETHDDEHDQTNSQQYTLNQNSNNQSHSTVDDSHQESSSLTGNSNNENHAINLSTSSGKHNLNSNIQPNKDPEIGESEEDSEIHKPDEGSEIRKPEEDSDTDTSEESASLNDSSDHVPADIRWLNPQYHENDLIKKPAELENDMNVPSGPIDKNILNRVQGSMIGMALGDALGAHVEFRPRQYLVQHPVTKLESGGTWGLSKGQFTDDTSMALCLANSLIANRGYNPYDQLVRYKWWYKHGYMSSTGQCFDIGAATRQSVLEFEQRQKKYASSHKISLDQIDYLPYCEHEKEFDVYCSEEEVAGNGALMRLAPVPLFFYRHPEVAVEYSGQSGQITHGDQKAYDACRYYGALIVAAVRGYSKADLLDNEFYSKHKKWFGKNELHPDIKSIAEGSYKRKNGYDDGIRGKGYIVAALEAALWAFWSDKDSFENGALAAVNLGDDTDTTAAIYGQLAGAYYGYEKLPKDWVKDVYAKTFMKKLRLAVGDALGASVEFRPHEYFIHNPVQDMEGGGTWGLKAGQWTDDTSMALCLASSLITKRGYDPYDQMVRYKWWYKHGYLSSTGQCFDIGNATRDSLEEFIRRQSNLMKSGLCKANEIDNLSWDMIQSVTKFDINCSSHGVAGNGALMRLTPVPLFFYRHPEVAVEYSGQSGQITHGDQKAYDACRYYGALIVAAVRGYSKEELLDNKFYSKHRKWFSKNELHPDIKKIAEGSYKRPKGYDDGIRGKGYIVAALEAALWAFWSDKDSFENGALAAVNLGDDTDTTAAIYGQLAGACYGYRSIPQKWLNKLYAHELLVCIGKWLHFLGDQPHGARAEQKTISSMDNSLTQPKQIKVGHFSTNNPGPNYHNTIHLNSTQIPSYPQESRPPREQKYPGKQSYASHPAANPDNDVVRYGATKNSPSPYTSGNSQSEKYQLASKPSTSNQQLTHSSTAYATDRPLYVPDPYDLSRTSNLSQIQAPMNNNYPLTRPNPGSRFESGASSNLGQTRYNNSSGSRTHTNNTNRQFGSSDSTSRNSPKFDGTKSLPYSYDPRNGWS
ncbi:unnamed protein product [Adineta steineri]|uniref:ADP-ribosylglycohydrolase n=3 Tax=Adineta steineri TaxID=433720 RepID=A0A815BXA3_9BILA|nr:unnamed protein product [Adineta steineri]CAF3658641.1 unnamed protein product [Adineta steineri]